jgi:ferrochelatase
LLGTGYETFHFLLASYSIIRTAKLEPTFLPDLGVPMRFKGQTEYDHKGISPRTGILLNNLGTPDAATAPALRVYLREFLSDPRVVEIPRVIWFIILYLFILTFRPKASAKLYQQIWTEAGSPLMDITQRQANALQLKLDEIYGQGVVPVVIGMRYGNPSVNAALKELTDQNVRNIIVLPLYPQYCAATVGSTFDAVSTELKKYRWVPELKFISGYHQNPKYLAAITHSIEKHIAKHGMPDKLIMSFHGTPERYLQQGDPYFCFCSQTSRLVKEKLKLDDDKVMLTFQSRFGKAPWLKPYTDATLKSLPAEGIKHVAIICPGFSADCLETIEEIESENHEYFMQAGGETFHYIPCLNDDAEHIDVMLDIVQPHLPIAKS